MSSRFARPRPNAKTNNDQVGVGAEAFRKTRADHAMETAEDYAEMIGDLIREHGEARLVDLADRMGVTHVTANRIVARLQKEGLVQTQPYRSIFLTDAGHKLAERSRRRHQLVYDFLQAIGVPQQQARIDAEGIEHHISQATLEAMARFVPDSRTTPPTE